MNQRSIFTLNSLRIYFRQETKNSKETENNKVPQFSNSQKKQFNLINMYITNQNNKPQTVNIFPSSQSSSGTSPENSSTNISHNDSFSSNSQVTQINLSNETLKNAYFLPKKLTTIYNYVHNQFQYQLFTNIKNKSNFYQEKPSQINTFSIRNNNKTSPYHLNFPFLIDEINQINTSQKNSYLYFRHILTTNENTNSLSLTRSDCPNKTNSNYQISSFNVYDAFTTQTNNCKSFQTNNNLLNRNIVNTVNNKLNFSYLGLNKINIRNINYKSSLNNINYTLHDKGKENTDVLKIKLKISDNKILTFKIRRYDDMFKTVKIFCEINHLEQKFIRSLILSVIKAMNIIYGIVNMTLNENEIEEITKIKEQLFLNE